MMVMGYHPHLCKRVCTGKPITTQRTELEEVKADRAALLRQLAAVHATPVDDWQQRDILTLRTELAARKSKYNQLIAVRLCMLLCSGKG